MKKRFLSGVLAGAMLMGGSDNRGICIGSYRWICRHTDYYSTGRHSE